MKRKTFSIPKNVPLSVIEWSKQWWILLGCGGGGGATNGCLSLPGSNPSGALAVFLSDVLNLNRYFRIWFVLSIQQKNQGNFSLLSYFPPPTLCALAIVKWSCHKKMNPKRGSLKKPWWIIGTVVAITVVKPTSIKLEVVGPTTPECWAFFSSTLSSLHHNISAA